MGAADPAGHLKPHGQGVGAHAPGPHEKPAGHGTFWIGVEGVGPAGQ